MLAMGCLCALWEIVERRWRIADDRLDSVFSKKQEVASSAQRTPNTQAKQAPRSWVSASHLSKSAGLISAGRKYLVVRGMPDVEVSSNGCVNDGS